MNTVAAPPTDNPTAVARAEQRVLNAFWDAAQRKGERLSLLLEYTHVVLRRPADWSQESVRTEHQAGDGSTYRADRSRCFACFRTAQLYRHHIIELQYGGSNTPRNQVPLCFRCHQALHPWLTDDDQTPSTRRHSGFESLGQIFSRTDVSGE